LGLGAHRARGGLDRSGDVHAGAPPLESAEWAARNAATAGDGRGHACVIAVCGGPCRTERDQASRNVRAPRGPLAARS
jgi:hypothetical protein